MENINLILGKCESELKKLADNSIDSIVTDPPYGINFMCKKWDYNIPSVEIWQECLRVLKPGGYLLSFAGTRTQHRMATNIEDAGFEIRDMIGWVYGQGFPKGMDISKGIDKVEGAERKITGYKKAGYCEGISKTRVEQGYRKNLTNAISEEIPITAPSTAEAQRWEGWNTNLKPSLEPVTMARKPLSEKSIVDNVLKWGVGCINIDGCRIPMESLEEEENYRPNAKNHKFNSDNSASYKMHSKNKKRIVSDKGYHSSKGRWPANLILDGSEEVAKLFPNTKSPQTYIRKSNGYSTGNSGLKPIGEASGKTSINFGDSGSAARFFYCAKVSKKERNVGCYDNPEKFMNSYDKLGGSKCGMKTGSGNERVGKNQNNHPTVKPLKLMKYLVTLITPANGTCLDPFMGSGTTGCACAELGFKFIGIDEEADYANIAQQRIQYFADNKHKDSQRELF